MEVNTALMLYKSLVRSVADYGIMFWFPTTSNLRLKVKRVQYKEIRTALGYKNNTLDNVIIAEAKVMLLKERARMLARNLLSKTMAHRQEDIKASLDKLVTQESYIRFKKPYYKKSIIVEAWKVVRRIKKFIETTENKFDVYNTKYWAITEETEIDY